LLVAEGEMSFKFDVIIFVNQEYIVSVERWSFDGNPESVMIKRRIFTKLRFQFGRHSFFSTKWRCLIFLVGFFRSLGSGDEKGIDFYQRVCLRL
jgi:hypothetical protein